MPRDKFRIIVGGDYRQMYSLEELMALGFDELLPYQDTLAWEFLPNGHYGQQIEGRQIEGFDGLVLSGQRVGAATLTPPVAQRLVTVARLGAGYDNIDLGACTAADVLVYISPHGLAHATALGALALLMSAGRRVLRLDRLVREGHWDERGSYLGADYLHHTLGVVGPGRIGRELIRLLAPFEMRVLAYSPRLTSERAHAIGVEAVPLATLMRESDFVCVTCSLTPETAGLLSAEMLALMKPSAYLVNVARGAVVDQAALTQALQERRIAGAGLDVFDHEPLAVDDPLTRLDNVVLSPHAACYSWDMGRRGVRDSVNGLVALAHGRLPNDIVNPDVLERPGFRAKLGRWAA